MLPGVLISYLFYTMACIYKSQAPNSSQYIAKTFSELMSSICLSLHLCLYFYFSKISSTVPFSRFGIYALIYDLCSSLSDFVLYDSF